MVNILHTYLILHHYFNSVIEKFKPKPLNLSMSPARFTKVSDKILYTFYKLKSTHFALYNKKQTLPDQLARLRFASGTQKVSLNAATFPS